MDAEVGLGRADGVVLWGEADIEYNSQTVCFWKRIVLIFVLT